jgi:hypothetical protein
MKSKITTIILICMLLASGASSVLLLRSNSSKVNYLRRQLEVADYKNKNVEAALNNLKSFVTLHMNTPLRSENSIKDAPIQLKYSYERALALERERVSALNVKLNAEAQSKCEALYGPEYAEKNGAKENPVVVDFYKYDFVSPFWSPDWAGIMSMITLLIFVILVMRLFIKAIVNRMLS